MQIIELYMAVIALTRLLPYVPSDYALGLTVVAIDEDVTKVLLSRRIMRFLMIQMSAH